MTNISESQRIQLTRDPTPNNHSIDSFPLFSQVTPFFPQSFIPAIHFPPLRLFAHLPTLSTSCMISLCSDWFTSLLTVVWQIQYDLVTKKPLLGRLQTCKQNSQACWAAAMSKCGYWRISYSGSSVRTPCSWYQLPALKRKVIIYLGWVRKFTPVLKLERKIESWMSLNYLPHVEDGFWKRRQGKKGQLNNRLNCNTVVKSSKWKLLLDRMSS